MSVMDNLQQGGSASAPLPHGSAPGTGDGPPSCALQEDGGFGGAPAGKAATVPERGGGLSRPVRAGKAAVAFLDGIADRIVLLFLFLMLSLGLYCLYDSSQVYSSADSAQYSAFKPEADDSKSFEELLAINPDVVGWLTVNDTPIDYPVVQAEDNRKYLDTTVEGEYRLSGSIFLDYRNSAAFTDYNSIIYGHHMEQEKMFGCLSDFGERGYFDAHPYGNLHLMGEDGKWTDKGLEFFAVILTDAYDIELYSPAVAKDERQAYLDHIRGIARHMRQMDVGAKDRIVLLSTCTSEVTNGRYLLAAKLTDTLHPQTKPPKVDIIGKGVDTLTRFPGILFWFVAALAIRAGTVLHRRSKG